MNRIEMLLELVEEQVSREKSRIRIFVESETDLDKLADAVLEFHRFRQVELIVTDALDCVRRMPITVEWEDVVR